MNTLNRRSLPCRQPATALLTLALLLAACGGGGGGGPRSPTDPTPTVLSIQGTWLGTATSLSVSGTCLADLFRTGTVPARWVIQQQGSSFTANLTLNNSITCPFRGNVSSTSAEFFAEPGGPPGCTSQTLACRNAPQRLLRMDLVANETVLGGTVSGNRLLLSGTSTLRVTDVRTGQIVGNMITVTAHDLVRQ